MNAFNKPTQTTLPAALNLGETTTAIDDATPRYRQLAARLQLLIEQGAFPSGSRLPSVRMLAEQAQSSPVTALTALRYLENLGLIEARPKSGYYVRAKSILLKEPHNSTVTQAASEVELSKTIMRVISAASRPNLVQLGAASPNHVLFPVSRLRKLLTTNNRTMLEAIGNYDMSMGHPELRTQIIRRYAHDSVLLKPEEIIVTVGAMEALNLCLRAVTQRGDTVAVESPIYFGILQIIESLGLKALEIPTSARDGISVDALELATRLKGQVKALIIMPTIQNPLSSVMSDSDKQYVAALMEERGIPIIEDDIYGELYIEHHRPRPLKAWDKTGNVMLCSSFTKTLAPGFRIGWVAAGRWQHEITHLKFTSSVATTALYQITIARFMETGGYDHHLRHLREAFQLQIRRVSEAIERYFPRGTCLSRPRGGYLLWVELPKPCNTLKLFDLALAAGIFTMPGCLFSTSERFDHHLRINCGDLWTPQIEHALKQLGELSQRCME